MKNSAIPKIIYGTAWKEDATADLTYTALMNGFSAVDTANQRKHYFEEAVGEGVQRFLRETKKSRDELFLQTKFTFARGQDHRLPYKIEDSYTQQVKDSFASSLAHLRTEYLDSFVLHGPFSGNGVSGEDFEVWSTMEELFKSGKVQRLGVSNFSAKQLKEFLPKVKVRPSFVQNRCFASQGWDLSVREICNEHGIFYQGFSLLTANVRELSTQEVLAIAQRHNRTLPQIVFRFAQQLKMIPLTGTTDPAHMEQDLNLDFELGAAELNFLEQIAYS